MTSPDPWVPVDRLRAIGVRLRDRKVDPIELVGGVPVLTIDSLPVLVQAVGYLKYKAGGSTYLRGQANLHSTMLPSLFRGAKNPKNRGNTLDAFLATTAPWNCRHDHHRVTECPERTAQASRTQVRLFGGGLPRFAAEPLLQHYGYSTRWLDLVDNLWIALWFACHWFDRIDGFRHPVRRTLNDGRDAYVYVMSVGLPGIRTQVAPGLVRVAGRGRVIDLREAAPSFYLRPHAQHGLLVRPHDDDYRNLELAALRIPLASALEWLGQSLLLSPFGLFPPPSVDLGYRRMLQASARMPDRKVLGQVDVYGAGY